MDFIPPSQVTESHVIIDVPGFSCFGLVTGGRNNCAIRGLVVIFSEISKHVVFVLLLPRNTCLTQVHRTHTHLHALLQHVPTPEPKRSREPATGRTMKP